MSTSSHNPFLQAALEVEVAVHEGRATQMAADLASMQEAAQSIEVGAEGREDEALCSVKTKLFQWN